MLGLSYNRGHRERSSHNGRPVKNTTTAVVLCAGGTLERFHDLVPVAFERESLAPEFARGPGHLAASRRIAEQADGEACHLFGIAGKTAGAAVVHHFRNASRAMG